MRLTIISKIKFPNSFLTFIDSVRSFYSRRYSDYMLDKSSFLARITTVSILSVCFGSIAWICFVKTDQIIIAQGKLIPFGQVKEIRAPENAVITNLLVSEGQKVGKNDPLIKLDNEVTLSSLSKNFDIIDNLKSQIYQKEAEKQIILEKINSSLDSFQSRLDILLHKRTLFKDLEEIGGISRVQVLDIEDKIIQLKNELAKGEFEKNELVKRFLIQTNKLKSDILSAEISLSKAKNDERYKIIRSPVEGVVFDLKPTSVGFLAQNREPILKIIPNTNLIASLEVTSDKIGFIRENDIVEVNIDSFPANDFGTVKGFISHIGSDALEPVPGKRRTLSYPVSVTLKNQYISTDIRQIPLQSGMSVAGHIKLRKVTYLQLLLNDLSSKVNAVREF